MLQVRDLEAELESEQRRSREYHASSRKLERSLTELRVTSEDDRRCITDLSENVNILTIRVKTLKRQLDEAVSFSLLNLIQYLKKKKEKRNRMKYKVVNLEKKLVSVNVNYF